MMSKIVDDPRFTACYYLFPRLGIQKSQRLSPDPVLPRARRTQPFRRRNSEIRSISVANRFETCQTRDRLFQYLGDLGCLGWIASAVLDVVGRAAASAVGFVRICAVIEQQAHHLW